MLKSITRCALDIFRILLEPPESSDAWNGLDTMKPICSDTSLTETLYGRAAWMIWAIRSYNTPYNRDCRIRGSLAVHYILTKLSLVFHTNMEIGFPVGNT